MTAADDSERLSIQQIATPFDVEQYGRIDDVEECLRVVAVSESHKVILLVSQPQKCGVEGIIVRAVTYRLRDLGFNHGFEALGRGC